MSETKDVVEWSKELAKYAKAAAASERPSVSRISLKGGVMTLLDQRIPNNELTCVVLAAVMEHAYYPNRYDPNNIEAPDCFAFSETGEDMVPHEKAFRKQNDTCLGCPQFEWGSDKNSPSGKGKACKQKRKLLIMPADALKNGTIKTAELAVMDIPVTSVRNWATYVNLLSATEARPAWAMVTKIKLEADPRTQIKVSFQPAFPIPEEFLSSLIERSQTARSVLMVPYEKTEEGLSKRTEAMQSGKKY